MSMPPGESPYKVLGVSREATEAEIKRAYFALIREHPPERDPDGFKHIRAAYEQLRGAGERIETDLFLIDDRAATLDPSTIQRSDVQPPPVTLATIKMDLLALEAMLLLEEVKASAR